jgi:hypothetical protein
MSFVVSTSSSPTDVWIKDNDEDVSVVLMYVF